MIEARCGFVTYSAPGSLGYRWGHVRFHIDRVITVILCYQLATMGVPCSEWRDYIERRDGYERGEG